MKHSWSRGSLLAFVVALFVIVSFRLGQATTSVRFDAVWWRGLDEHDQVVAVQGAMSGYQWGYEQGLFAGEYRLAMRLPRTSTFFTPVRNALADHVTKSDLPGFPNTFGSYVHGVSDFYDNHAQSADDDVGEVMGCLSTRPPKRCKT